MPFKKVKDWAWKSYWIIGGVFSWLVIPFMAAYLTVPRFMGIIRGGESSLTNGTCILEALWGIGGLTSGLAIRYLGIA